MKPRVFPLAAIVVAASAFLAACNRGSDETSAIAAARNFTTQGDYKSAVISAKNAIQQNPESAEARYVLGQALLEGGDVGVAAIELRKARELGIPDAKVVPLLARAMLAQGQAGEVVTEFASTHLEDPKASADLQTTVAAAHAQAGDRDKALAAVLSALKDVPQHADATLLHAKLMAAGNDMAAALTLTEQLLGREPKHVAALLFKGQLQRQHLHEDDKALATFREAILAKPDSVAAHAAVVSMLLEKRDYAAAKVDFAKMKAAAPAHPETRMLEAQLSYIDGEFTKTRELTAQLLKVYPNHPLILQLAGSAEMRLNSLSSAENYLGQAIKAAPRALVPRQLLAQIYLRSGKATQALEVLQPVVSSPSPDATSLTLAGQAYLQEGDSARSEAMYAQAAKVDPKNATARTAMALNKFAKGNPDGALADLEATAASDTGSRADLALIATRLRTKDLAGAQKAVDALEKKQPQWALPKVLRGRIQLLQKDVAGATASFEKALQVDPVYFPAAASLAAIDLAAGRTAPALQRFENLLKTDPKNVRAILGLAEVKVRTGAPKEDVIKLMSDAVKANPSDPVARLALVKYLSSQGDTDGALAAAQEAGAALPTNADVLERLGAAQLAAGQAQQAVSTFVKLAAQRPTRPEPELALADAHLANKDFDAARRSLERALKIQPKLPAGQIGMAKLAMMQKRPADALAIARSMQSANPKMPGPYVLEAEIETAQGNLAGAVAPLKSAVPLAPDARVAIQLHRTLVNLGRKDEAERVAAGWRKDHPRDVAFTFYLGDVALANKDFAQAEVHYRSVAEMQPANALAWNNVAWLLTRQQKPGAVPLAEKANELMPNQAPLMDTLAWALANENQLKRGLELQKKAVAAAPKDAGLKLTLAKIYIKAGERAQARAELDALAKLGADFAGQAEVAELIKAL